MEVQILYNSYLPAFLSMFLLIYLFAFFVTFRNWGPKHRPEASSCLISLAHGTPAVVMAIHAKFQTQRPTCFASPNTSYQNIVLEFSIAYFLLDLFHYIISNPNEIVFISHHLATLYVFMTCRYIVHHGALPILVLLVLAEVTSPCQNLWSITGFTKADIPTAARFHEFLSPRFYALHSIFRGILGPIFVYKMGVFYKNGAADRLIPNWAWISWMFVIATAILVSLLWICIHWIDWHNERIQKADKKV
ncbi:TLC domain-containing protein [Quillaja saponaria]|uniref:TLC domain-containing protein n=1 Tax=Quillaja saponaria TaxID=32244 RepID=A0AAD7KTI3_QUISA|nr:TLC domain-containing protein [Quillaja saponaria]